MRLMILTKKRIFKIHRFLLLLLFTFIINLPIASFSKAVEKSIRPKSIFQEYRILSEPGSDEIHLEFIDWISNFRITALAAGISPKFFDKLMLEIKYNETLIKLDRKQSEFTKQIWEYLDVAVSDTRIKNGKRAYQENKEVIQEIEKYYSVDAKIIVGIWGLESAYGVQKGNVETIEALATLAFDGRRQKFFEEQLIAALKILERGDISFGEMKGSWAGAMGHTQFIPTSYLEYAQDFNSDGRAEIWSSDPTDALASTAYYLNRHGWIRGQPWGLEVRLPENFNYHLIGKKKKKNTIDWSLLGVRTINGDSLPNYGGASIILPAGHMGVVLMIFDNFHVLEKYNASLAYVLGVGHLGDRIMDGKSFHHKWPRNEEALSTNEKKELQEFLLHSGFNIGKVDGMIGPKTIEAIRSLQSKLGKIPDGFATKDFLKGLK
tara:strand:+ start:142 stop:1446 length:1305 start_codon:yes stop_codon:yes gene_type:complete